MLAFPYLPFFSSVVSKVITTVQKSFNSSGVAAALQLTHFSFKYSHINTLERRDLTGEMLSDTA